MAKEKYHIVLDFLENRNVILDVGCGSSKILEAIPQAIGMDIGFNKLRFRRTLINPLVNGDIFSIPFRNSCVDEVICSEVVEHLPSSEEVFKELNRVVKKEGILIIGTPDSSKRLWGVIEAVYNLVCPNGHCSEHITHYTFESLTEKLKKFGFEIVDYRYIFGCELIIKAVKHSDLTT